MSGTSRPPTSQANRGKPFEDALEAMHEFYKGRGHCFARFPTPYKVIRRQGASLVVVPEKPAEPDFMLIACGLSIVADAKSTIGGSWPLSKLEEHQAAFFSRWTDQSEAHRAGVILCIQPEGIGQTIWWVDWSILRLPWETWFQGNAKRGMASLNTFWLTNNAVQVKNLDWLTAARSIQ
jgi:hypothetical protein